MPKIVNHEERRRELLTATWRVIARTGIVGATTREIARRRGCRRGCWRITSPTRRRSWPRRCGWPTSSSTPGCWSAPRGCWAWRRCAVIMVEAMPLDDERLLEAQIELNFIAVSLGNAGLREMRQEEVDRFWESLHYRTAEAQKIGQIDPAATSAPSPTSSSSSSPRLPAGRPPPTSPSPNASSRSSTPCSAGSRRPTRRPRRSGGSAFLSQSPDMVRRWGVAASTAANCRAAGCCTV